MLDTMATIQRRAGYLYVNGVCLGVLDDPETKDLWMEWCQGDGWSVDEAEAEWIGMA